MFDKLRRLFAAPPPPPPPPAGPPPREDDSTRFAAATYRARDAYWAGIGAVEGDLLTHLISPSFMGGPAWPTTRQAFRVVRRGGGLILATDGLADPFDGVSGAGNGFGLELFIETADIPPAFAGAPGEIGALSGSWAFEVLKQVSGTVAQAGGIEAQLARHGVLSMELPGVSQASSLPAQLPAHFVGEGDALGVLLGGPPPDFPVLIPEMPLSAVQVVPVVLLTGAELAFLRAGGAEARRELAARLAATPAGHRTVLGRDSLA